MEGVYYHNVTQTEAEGTSESLVLCLPAPTEYVPNIKSSYLDKFVDPKLLARSIDYAVRVLRHWDFDSIAFTGVSGALIGPSIAMRMGKTFIVVRKRTEQGITHTARIVEGDYNARRYVIVDDFVCSGDTKRRVIEEISKEMPSAVCLGILEVNYIYEDELAVWEGKRYPLR